MAFVPFPAGLGTPRDRLPLEAARSGAAVCGVAVSSGFILRLRRRGGRGIQRCEAGGEDSPETGAALKKGLDPRPSLPPSPWLNMDLKRVFVVFWGMYGEAEEMTLSER